MIEVSTRLDRHTGDTWVLASYRTERNEVAVYEIRVPYLDCVRTDSEAVLNAAKGTVSHRLERMIRAYRGY